MDVSDKAMLQRLIDYTERSTDMEDEDILAFGYLIGMCSRYRIALQNINQAATIHTAQKIARDAVNE